MIPPTKSIPPTAAAPVIHKSLLLVGRDGKENVANPRCFVSTPTLPGRWWAKTKDMILILILIVMMWDCILCVDQK